MSMRIQQGLLAIYPVASAVDVMWDAATWTNGTGTLSNGNKSAFVTTTNQQVLVRADTSRATGKYYCEFLCNHTSPGVAGPKVGLLTNMTQFPDGSANGSYFYKCNTIALWLNGTNTAPGSSITANDVIAFAVNLTTGSIWVARNNTWYSGDPGAGTSPSATGMSGTFYPGMCDQNNAGSNATVTLACKVGDFTYSVPSGFTGWAG